MQASTADLYFDTIGAALRTDAFRPRALFDRFNIEVLATTQSPVDRLDSHRPGLSPAETGLSALSRP